MTDPLNEFWLLLAKFLSDDDPPKSEFIAELHVPQTLEYHLPKTQDASTAELCTVALAATIGILAIRKRAAIAALIAATCPLVAVGGAACVIYAVTKICKPELVAPLERVCGGISTSVGGRLRILRRIFFSIF